ALAKADGILAVLLTTQGLSQRIAALGTAIVAGPSEAAAVSNPAPNALDWLAPTQRILGHLGNLGLRVQSESPVPPTEFEQAARELDELQDWARKIGPAGQLLQMRTQQYMEKLRPYLPAAVSPRDIPAAAGADITNVLGSFLENERKKDE